MWAWSSTRLRGAGAFRDRVGNHYAAYTRDAIGHFTALLPTAGVMVVSGANALPGTSNGYRAL